MENEKNEIKKEAATTEKIETLASVEEANKTAIRKSATAKARSGNNKFSRQREVPEYEEIIVSINRVSKTVKGGRRMRFSVLAAIGNGKGTVGFGTGKANEVPDAIKKALASARKNLFKIGLVKGTISHEIIGKYGAVNVFLKPAPQGTGIIAGGPVRSVLELAGNHNVYSKVYGARTPINVVRATIDGLSRTHTIKQIALARGKEIKEIR